jgi:hypothetical protein
MRVLMVPRWRVPALDQLFDALEPAFSGKKLEKTYAEVGAAFSRSEGAIKAAVHTMSKRLVD